ncbi:Wzz/FepE/Etk N-terminal domain-containing protein [Chitinophaga silvisoli]|uniref:Lipopolysaccharide biosynthesis protein n=1 Tax=Chitinophaga silvisoli TaxID=2291814 RepID=A0A3E1P6N1_9BACT|nr:Wzz/FepE/Etk N-terminal domain-containing protein [Chitinophaga silvisoli]RFM35845.1 lipopolysaccharide biosynthesis protein [Chitinophaga silvisoli]
MNLPNQLPDNAPKREISLKDLILVIQEWVGYLWKKKLIIILVAVLGAVIGVTVSIFKKPKYTGQLSFVLEESSKSSMLGSYSSIANSLGVDLGGLGGSSSGLFAGDNIMEFLKSRLMVEKALLSPITINGKEISLADYYIDLNEFREQWKKDEQLASLANIHFPVGEDRSKFSLQQDSVLFELYHRISEKDLTVEKPDKKISFIYVTCLSEDQLFAKYFVEELVKEATSFYVTMKTQRSKVNVDKLQAKADSIERLLNQKTYTAAAAKDLNINPAKVQAAVGLEVASRDKTVLQTMYAEVVKNLELSKVSMSQETPIIQIVDTPILPLKKKRFGKMMGIVIGGFLGGFLSVIGLILLKFYKKIMAN